MKYTYYEHVIPNVVYQSYNDSGEDHWEHWMHGGPLGWHWQMVEHPPWISELKLDIRNGIVRIISAGAAKRVTNTLKKTKAVKTGRVPYASPKRMSTSRGYYALGC